MKVAKDEENQYIDTQTLYGVPNGKESERKSDSDTSPEELFEDYDKMFLYQ